MSSSTRQPLWLRCEKKEFERRAALTPTTARKLIDAGFDITVERDPQRIFDDEEYEKVGCKLVENNTYPNAPLEIPIIGLKELPVSTDPLPHTHIQFAHCYKNQAGWAAVLTRFARGGGTLYDLEFLQDESGRRVAAFGFHAGFAGAAAAALALADRKTGSPSGALTGLKLEPYNNEGEMVSDVREKLSKVKNADGTPYKPKALVIGALGRCGRGAVELFRKIGLEEDDIFKWDMAETAIEMHLSENEGIEGNRFVVTGGLGFVGAALCLELVRRGAEEVRSFDTRSCSPWSLDLQKNGVRCIRGDVSQKMNLKEALKGANCVFHLASYGMSGKEMLLASRIDEVNLNGTCNVLDVCHEVGIKRLVYVSTYNVVFGGKEIVNGNESLPYYPIDDHVDPYGRSKSIAEQLVLKSNGRSSKKKSGDRLYTCAIRPAAIYGPGEQRHFPRILSLAQMSLAFFKVGDANVKTDWVYVDNLVLALILASMGLLDDIPGRKGHPIAAGQAYFISDGSPVNSFNSIINPLFKSLDYDVPKFTISVKHALLMSQICWFVWMFLYPWLNHSWVPGPLLLPAEVYKIGVTHYFSYLKAKEELGYVPIISPREGLAKTISYWKDRKRRELDRPNIFMWIYVIFGMTGLFYTAFLPTFWPLRWLNSIALFIFRSVWNLRFTFYLAVLVHLGEAIYVWFRARRLDPANATGWFWQTFILGFASMKLFIKRAKQA